MTQRLRPRQTPGPALCRCAVDPEPRHVIVQEVDACVNQGIVFTLDEGQGDGWETMLNVPRLP